MMGMARLSRKKYVRTHPRALLALKRLVIELSGSGRLTFEGGPVTEEAFVCASWLWLESMGAEAVEAGIAPHLARLDALVAGAGEGEGETATRDAPAAPHTHMGHAIVPTVVDEGRDGAGGAEASPSVEEGERRFDVR